jgi:hypothetical protein
LLYCGEELISISQGMKSKNLILAAFLLILAGAGCQRISSNSNKAPGVNTAGGEKPVHVVMIGGVEAAVPPGSAVWSHVTNPQQDMAIVIAPESVYESVKTIQDGELPVPFVNVTVHANPQKLGAEEWARQNAPLSNFAVRTGDVQQATVGGRPGISYVTEGLYRGTTLVTTTSDANFAVVVTDNHSDMPGGMDTTFTQKVIDGILVP